MEDLTESSTEIMTSAPGSVKTNGTLHVQGVRVPPATRPRQNSRATGPSGVSPQGSCILRRAAGNARSSAETRGRPQYGACTYVTHVQVLLPAPVQHLSCHCLRSMPRRVIGNQPAWARIIGAKSRQSASGASDHEEYSSLAGKKVISLRTEPLDIARLAGGIAYQPQFTFRQRRLAIADEKKAELLWFSPSRTSGLLGASSSP